MIFYVISYTTVENNLEEQVLLWHHETLNSHIKACLRFANYKENENVKHMTLTRVALDAENHDSSAGMIDSYTAKPKAKIVYNAL